MNSTFRIALNVNASQHNTTPASSASSICVSVSALGLDGWMDGRGHWTAANFSRNLSAESKLSNWSFKIGHSSCAIIGNWNKYWIEIRAFGWTDATPSAIIAAFHQSSEMQSLIIDNCRKWCAYTQWLQQLMMRNGTLMYCVHCVRLMMVCSTNHREIPVSTKHVHIMGENWMKNK